MRIVILALLSSCLLFWPRLALAHQERDLYQLELDMGAGGPLGLAFGENHVAPTTDLFSLRFGLAARLPRYCPFGIEATVVFNTQFGIGGLLDVISIDPIRLSLNSGVSWATHNPISVKRIRRSYDWTVGAQLAWRFYDDWRVTLDYRAFVPEPEYIARYYATFSHPMFEEAFKGGQIWLGVAYVWH